MRLVILESPYAGTDLDKNLSYGRACLKDCLDRGEAPIASHLLYTQEGVLDDTDPLQRSKGIGAGHAGMNVADALVVYMDEGISPGMLQGIEKAKYLRLPIEYRKLS